MLALSKSLMARNKSLRLQLRALEAQLVDTQYVGRAYRDRLEVASKAIDEALDAMELERHERHVGELWEEIQVAHNNVFV